MNTDCIDLRIWAKTKRYRWRYEESYYAERPEYRGDGRWYVEVICRYGLIYPFGGDYLLAYANRGIKRFIRTALGCEIQHHQNDGDNEVFRFPSKYLDDVAAVLKPKRKRATGASLEQLEAMRERKKSLAQNVQTAKN